jgi:osmoprotectant transport system ATP-binding protein
VKAPVLEFAHVSKDYRGLRPLRIERLEVSPGDRVAIFGLDQTAAEVFVNLATGAMLPDRGEVRLFGRPTSTIGNSEEWLTIVDRIGIFSERAVLLDGLSVEQNLAMPFTLEIQPLSDETRHRAAALAREVDLPARLRQQSVAGLDAVARARVRLGRALALDPEILLLEHPTRFVARDDGAELGRQVRTVAEQRRLAIVAATADRAFARTAADRVLTLRPATGRLVESRYFF